MKIERLAKVFSALSDPTRISILLKIKKRGLCVSELQAQTGMRQPNVSQHLKVLKEAGLVIPKRKGKKICYSLSDDSISEMIALAKKQAGKSS